MNRRTDLRWKRRHRLVAAPSATPPAWSPADLSNLVAWYDADDPATFTFSSGSVVSQWNDKSGNGYNLAQAVVAQQPSRSGSQNGRPTVIFDGIDDYLRSPTFAAIPQPYTIVAMFRWSAPANDRRLCSSGANTMQILLFGGSRYTLFAGGLSTIGAVQTANAQCAQIVFNGAASEIFQDGASIGTGNPSNAAVAAPFVMGARADGTLFGNVEVFEMLVVSSTLSPADASEVLSYSQTKWATP